jgi:hypothetical protein
MRNIIIKTGIRKNRLTISKMLNNFPSCRMAGTALIMQPPELVKYAIERERESWSKPCMDRAILHVCLMLIAAKFFL